MAKSQQVSGGVEHLLAERQLVDLAEVAVGLSGADRDELLSAVVRLRETGMGSGGKRWTCRSLDGAMAGLNVKPETRAARSREQHTRLLDLAKPRACRQKSAEGVFSCEREDAFGFFL